MAKKKDPVVKTETEVTTTEAAAPVVEKPAKIEANGVTRPTAGTKTGRVWEIADELSAAKGGPAERKDVMERGKAEDINPSTVMTQFGRWRAFHGLVNKRAPKAEGENTVEAGEAPAAGSVVESAAAE